nr:MAG TPA_asm: hypothetical protein [Caudoviricetes sp.]
MIDFNLPLFCVLWLKIKVYNYINRKIKWLKIDCEESIFVEISIKNKFLKRLTNI